MDEHDFGTRERQRLFITRFATAVRLTPTINNPPDHSMTYLGPQVQVSMQKANCNPGTC